VRAFLLVLLLVAGPAKAENWIRAYAEAPAPEAARVHVPDVWGSALETRLAPVIRAALEARGLVLADDAAAADLTLTYEADVNAGTKARRGGAPVGVASPERSGDGVGADAFIPSTRRPENNPAEFAFRAGRERARAAEPPSVDLAIRVRGPDGAPVWTAYARGEIGEGETRSAVAEAMARRVLRDFGADVDAPEADFAAPPA